MEIDRNIGSAIKAVKGIKPTNSAAGTINGASIDRMASGSGVGYLSGVLHHKCGDASGTPTSFTVDSKLQESSDESTWTDVSGAAATQLVANNTDAEKDIDLSGCKRYVRTVTVVAFVGGTTPAVPVAADLVLGGALSLPA